MYQPPHFREDDLGVQHALIRAHPLGLLITAGASGPMANPLPFLLEAAPGKGVLKAHMAKANQQWREIGACWTPRSSSRKCGGWYIGLVPSGGPSRYPLPGPA